MAQHSAELAPLLTHPSPSAADWTQLCTLLASPPWERTAQTWLPEVEAALSGWDISLRTWPKPWWKRKKPPAAAALVRSAAVSLTAPQVAAFLAQLTHAAPPLQRLSIEQAGFTPDAPPGLLEALQAIQPTLRDLFLKGFILGDLSLGPVVADLECLRLPSCGLNDARLRGILSASPSLRLLNLGFNGGLSSALGAILSEGALSAHLEDLDLTWTMTDDPDAGVTAMAARTWAVLSTLVLHNVSASPAALAALLRSTPALQSLDLLGNQALTGAALPLLWEALPAGLQTLRLTHSSALQSELAALLEQPTHAPGLRALALSGTQCGARLGAALETRAPHLTSLDITRSSGENELFYNEISRLKFPALRHLRLSDHTLEPASAQALARLDFPALQHADLQYCRMTGSAAAILARAPWMVRLSQT